MTDRPAWLDAMDVDGNLDRRVSVRSWGIFPVELVPENDEPAAPGNDKSFLLCERADRPFRYIGYRAGVFERFLLLAAEKDTAIASFANQFGRLGLCRHGMPLTLADSCTELRATAARVRGFIAERPEHWRAWARRFTAAISVARRLSDDAAPNEADVSMLTKGLRHYPDAAATAAALLGTLDGFPPEKLAVVQNWYFCRLFNSWMSTHVAMTDTRAASRRLRLEYGAGGLFATLALQAALAATGARAFVVCSNCGRGFEAVRQPSKGDRAYCPNFECRVKAKNRDAAADKRRRGRRPVSHADHGSQDGQHRKEPTMNNTTMGGG